MMREGTIRRLAARGMMVGGFAGAAENVQEIAQEVGSAVASEIALDISESAVGGVRVDGVPLGEAIRQRVGDVLSVSGGIALMGVPSGIRSFMSSSRARETTGAQSRAALRPPTHADRPGGADGRLQGPGTGIPPCPRPGRGAGARRAGRGGAAAARPGADGDRRAAGSRGRGDRAAGRRGAGGGAGPDDGRAGRERPCADRGAAAVRIPVRAGDPAAPGRGAAAQEAAAGPGVDNPKERRFNNPCAGTRRRSTNCGTRSAPRPASAR